MARRRDWREARAKVDLEGVCRVCRCGYDHIDAAHVIPRSLAPNHGEQGDAIVGLCRACHTDYDEHRLDLLPYLSLAEQVSAVKAAGGIERARRIISGREA